MNCCGNCTWNTYQCQQLNAKVPAKGLCDDWLTDDMEDKQRNWLLQEELNSQEKEY